MPGTNAGTGHPLTARCWRCRRRYPSHVLGDGRHGRGVNLIATGRWKITPTCGGMRMLPDGMTIEYRCADCGYKGYSRHRDMVRALRKAGLKLAPAPWHRPGWIVAKIENAEG